MDGLKINVNKEGANKAAAAQKKAVKKPAAKKNVKKESAKTKPKSKNSFLNNLIVFIITALIVGGGIYFWQQQRSEDRIDKISENAVTTRIDFEQRIENLKNKILGLEKSKKELEQENITLKERVELLDGAKKDFSDSELGLAFEYPALFGEVKVTIHEGATGTSFMGEFTKNEKLKFGGLSRDYASDSTSTELDIIDTLGYYSERNKYYFQPAGDGENQDFELQPAKIIGAPAGEVLLLDKKSFVGQDEFSKASGDTTIGIGENVAGLANLKDDIYGGVVFVNMDFGIMPLENFENMLASVEVR